MSVQAYLVVGQTVVPALLPTAPMRATARQIGIPEEDLFRVDVPAGMTQHTRASILVASTQIATIYSQQTVNLVLEDSSGISVSLLNMYARPPQPFFWGQGGGVALVELVDQRWYWKFSSAAVLDQALTPLWSSDGRWQVNASDIASYTDLLGKISDAANADGLTIPANFNPPGTEYLRRLGDMIGSPNVSLGMLIDAMAVTSQQIVLSVGDGSNTFVDRSDLKTQYTAKMNTYRVAYRGGMQPTNGSATSIDPLVSIWNATGYQARAPRSCSVVLPQRAVEGLTVYDNVTLDNTSLGDFTQQNFTQKQLYVAGSAPSWVRAPNDIGSGYIPDASVVAMDSIGAVLTSAPGWNPTPLSTQIRQEYANRYMQTPFGKTVWAGWIPWINSVTNHLGQIGNVSYRLAEDDGVLCPFTISECREDDWRFSLQGCAESEPINVITAKGKAQAYRNSVGMTIVDVPPPNTRVFPAKILLNEEYATWKWRYSWVEVEPEICGPQHMSKQAVSVGAYARKSDTICAINMAENGNVYISHANSGNVIAPGVYQGQYTNGQVIEAIPICEGTIVEMVEHFPTIVGKLDNNTLVSPEPQYWFSMPNAVYVSCANQQQ